MVHSRDPFLDDPRTLYEILGVPNFTDAVSVAKQREVLLTFQPTEISHNSVFESDSIPRRSIIGDLPIERVLRQLRYTDTTGRDLASPAEKLSYIAPKFFPSDFEHYNGLADYASLASVMRARKHAFALMADSDFKSEYDRLLGRRVDGGWEPPHFDPKRHIDLAAVELTRDPDAGIMPEGATRTYISKHVLENARSNARPARAAERAMVERNESARHQVRKENVARSRVLAKRTIWLAAIFFITWLIASQYSPQIVAVVAVFAGYGMLSSDGFRKHVVGYKRVPVIDDLGLLNSPAPSENRKQKFVGSVGRVGKFLVGLGVLCIFGLPYGYEFQERILDSDRAMWALIPIVLQPLLAVLAKRGARKLGGTVTPWAARRAQGAERRQLESSRKLLSTKRIFGEAGGGLEAATERFGEDRVAAGVKGEQMTVFQLAAALELMQLDYKLFNSLKIPGLGEADVDHVLLLGDNAILIDSKKWAPGFYTQIGDMIVGTYFLEDGPERFVSYSVMAYAVDAFRRHLAWTPGARGYNLTNITKHDRLGKVEACIIAHPDDPTKPFGVHVLESQPGVKLTDLHDFVSHRIGSLSGGEPRFEHGHRCLSLMKTAPSRQESTASVR